VRADHGMAGSSREDRKTLHPGKLVDDYTILRLLGQGGYGDIYEVLDNDSLEHYALKLEMAGVRKQALRREYEIMRLLHSPFFPGLVRYAECARYRYLVMEMCGPSFSAVRRLLPGCQFSLSTVLRAGIEMLRAIEAFHRRGILHRDIKPSNFLIRPSRRHPVALIDYGLSRVFRDARTGAVLPARERPGFVGTSKYASLNAHKGVELGRRDDLFSWFFSMLEMWEGRLPWSGGRDKQRVYAQKCETDVLGEIGDMPRSMRSVYRLIRRLDVDDEPDYRLLISFMVQAMRECDAQWEDPYEWETMDLRAISPLSLIPDSDDERESLGELPAPVMPPRPAITFTRDGDVVGRPWRPMTELRQLRPYALYDEKRPRRL
jgi:serine/threonine protein kinase